MEVHNTSGKICKVKKKKKKTMESKTLDSY